jgi:predicted N-formylglutamate amidohydrolase
LNERCTDSLHPSNRLLGRDDPSPFVVTNPGGSSPVVLIGDHAGRLIPRLLGDLGLPPSAMDRHIAWDIGVAEVGERLAEALDAVLIRQAYSRLVIDCNRRPGAADSSPVESDGQPVPGNVGLGDADRDARRDEIWTPYQDRIAAELNDRARRGQVVVLVSLHSFTPVFQGRRRPWRYGVLHRGDSILSGRMLTLLRRMMGAEAGDNQPYAMDAKDMTVPLHADPRRLDYLELEVRQDLIASPDGASAEAQVIAKLLRRALHDES